MARLSFTTTIDPVRMVTVMPVPWKEFNGFETASEMMPFRPL